MADLPLPDPVYAAEALLQAVGVPGQVVVDHEVRPLQVDALAGRVVGDHDERLLVLGERLDGPPPFFAPDAAVDDDDRLRPPEPGPYPVREVVKRLV